MPRYSLLLPHTFVGEQLNTDKQYDIPYTSFASRKEGVSHVLALQCSVNNKADEPCLYVGLDYDGGVDSLRKTLELPGDVGTIDIVKGFTNTDYTRPNGTFNLLGIIYGGETGMPMPDSYKPVVNRRMKGKSQSSDVPLN